MTGFVIDHRRHRNRATVSREQAILNDQHIEHRILDDYRRHHARVLNEARKANQ